MPETACYFTHGFFTAVPSTLKNAAGQVPQLCPVNTVTSTLSLLCLNCFYNKADTLGKKKISKKITHQKSTFAENLQFSFTTSTEESVCFLLAGTQAAEQ